MNSPTTISLVRHGHIENPDRVFHGRLPGFPLSEQGEAEAAAAAALLQDEPVVAIYSSPMLRTRQTAAILQAAFRPQPPITEEPLLNEIYSPYDGRPWAELEAREWDFYTGTDPQYEHPQAILARVLAFLQRERERHRGEHVAGVTHADPLAFLWLWLFEKPLTADIRKRLDEFGLADDYPATASVTTLTYATADPEEKPRYRYINPT